ncbi:MAG: holo-ACP synthase [Lentisphaeria bacterium]|jgi:holo-[acyl-carrier protein] synthase
MILGTGIDIIEVARIRQALERHGEAFVRRVFTPAEIALAPAAPAAAAAFYAGRWAAKEAVAKTLGTGIGAACAWTDLQVLRQPSGAPRLELAGAAAATAQRLAIARIHLSISHLKETACAVAVAEGATATS